MRRPNVRTIVPTLLTIAVAALVSATPASAQTPAGRGYFSVNGFFQTSAGFSDLAQPIEFQEAARIVTDYGQRGAPGFDVGIGTHVWRALAVGVDVGWSSRSGAASVDAQLPHPFFFNRPRAVAGDAGGLTRTEAAVNIEARLAIPTRSRSRVSVFAGPSWIHVDQDLVANVNVNDVYPFDTPSFASAATQRHTASRAGFNAGGDFSYMLRPRVGVGVDLRYTRARVRLTDATTVVAGGPRVGAGLRVAF
jgi:hypothetical protein